MILVFLTLSGWACCAGLVIWLACHAPEMPFDEQEYEERMEKLALEKMKRRVSTSKVDRINDLIALASHHREQTEAIAVEFVGLHDYTMQSIEGRELADVVWFGDDYPQALDRVMAMKKLKQRTEKRNET